MSSSESKLQRKRPADSEDIDPDDSAFGKPGDIQIKTLDEILKEKRRRIEDDYTIEGGKKETSDGSLKVGSSPLSAKQESQESTNSSRKQGSPHQPESEVIYQLSPETLSLSPRKLV